MSCQEFITNLNGLQDGGNFPKELLKVRYKGLLPGRLPAWGLGPGDWFLVPRGKLKLRPGSAHISSRGQGLKGLKGLKSHRGIC